MKKIFLLLAFGAFLLSAAAQEVMPDTAWKHLYRGTYPKINDLVHTKLAVSFDFDKQWLYGEEWVTLQPHFYDTDSLQLDAKGMDIKEIALVNGKSTIPLKYSYDSMKLNITLNQTYHQGNQYTVYLKYISKPNDLKLPGSDAIKDAKGLYFINPKGLPGGDPTQIWTQGEPESNSAWFPTIDKPDQKTTQEIAMTVPSQYVTLSNGLLVSQKKNADGTRTDNWKMDLPNSPYLFFMGVGDYAIVKDRYKNIEVSYYVEKPYESVARKIFGATPAMIGYFSKILDVPYAWPKYNQIVGRQYVSGAMENTTATLHQDGAYQNARQLVDGNSWEDVISHELFHHWFGDLVTTESWSNLTLNESFANYSEYLWRAHRYGKDDADQLNYEDMQGYLNSGSDQKNLVRFYYHDNMDMFDNVSYNKGGRILHMLQNYVGDAAFFKSLKRYLTLYRFQSAEAHQLRLAFEEVTGQDLNWFWNQWYFGSGEPSLDIRYNYSDGKARVIVDQVQSSGKLFKLPVAIDVYSQGSQKNRYKVWLQNPSDTFYFASAHQPSFINVDADKILLARISDHKTAAEFEQQYRFAPNYLDRRQALDYFAENKLSSMALGLNDPFSGLRLLTLTDLEEGGSYTVPSVLSIIEQMAVKDPDKKVQAKAMEMLAMLRDLKYQPIFEKELNDSSYSVAGAALLGITRLEPDQAYTLAKKYSSDAMGKLGGVVASIFIEHGAAEDFPFLLNYFKKERLSEEILLSAFKFAGYLAKTGNATQVKEGVDQIMALRNKLSNQDQGYVDPSLKQALHTISAVRRAGGDTELSTYIDELLP